MISNPNSSFRRGGYHKWALPLWQSRGGVALFLSALIGYPLVGLSVTFAGVESKVITQPFRVLVLSLSVLLLASGLLSPFRGRLDPWFSSFLIIYLSRLFFDFGVNSIPGTSEALQFYLAIVLAPTLAISACGIGHYSDQTIARGLIVLGSGVTALALLAQFMGLAFNPWLEQGVDNTRLGFEALNPISLGHAAVSTILAGLVLLATPGITFPWRLSSVIGIVSGGMILVQAGSRGALVAFVVCILWFGMTKTKRLAYLGPLLICGVGLVLIQTDIFQHTINTATGGWASDASSLERLESQRIAIEDFLDAPLFGKHHANPGLQQGTYPHNIVIEAAMALGVFGLLILVSSLFRGVRNILGSFNDEHPLLTLLLLQQFANALLSGCLWGSDALYILLMFTLTEGNRSRQRLAPYPSVGRGVSHTTAGNHF